MARGATRTGRGKLALRWRPGIEPRATQEIRKEEVES